MNTAISPEIKIESPVSPISTENGGYICSLCGTRGDLKSTILGSFIVEALLWLCFIVPGIMYYHGDLQLEKEAVKLAGQSR